MRRIRTQSTCSPGAGRPFRILVRRVREERRGEPDGGDGSLTVPDAPVAGRRSFDMIAVLSGDGSTNLPPNNRFTMVLDIDARRAIVGGNGRGAIIGITSNDGRTFHSAGAFEVGGDASPCSGTTGLKYDNFEVTLANGSLTGTANGSASISCGDCVFLVPFGATLTGTVDVTPPRLLGSGFTPSTPFDSLGLVVSEPLPVGATARLVADDGAAMISSRRLSTASNRSSWASPKREIVLRAGQDMRSRGRPGRLRRAG